jgi:TonB-dependent receptor
MSPLNHSRRGRLLIGASIVALGAFALAAPAMAQDTTDTKKPAKTDGEVIVTGQRAALRSAQLIKKNADQLVDSITAVDIGALPDRSVTEALQRIPGVTITLTPDPRDADRISIEGSGVAVRGLSYVRSELNGRDSFSAKNGRQLSFDDVPPELMAGVDVYKNPSAEIVEGGVGGTVNLRTRLPFDQPGRLIAYSLDENYADLVKAWTPAGSVMFSDRWQTPVGEFGLLVDLSDSKFRSRTDTVSVDPFFARDKATLGSPIAGQPVVYVPGGFGYRSLVFNRERQGIDIATQWKPNDKFLVTASFFRSAAYSTENENAVGIDPGTGFNPAAGTSFTYDANGRYTNGTMAATNPDVIDDRFNTTRSVTSDYSLNAKWFATDKLTLSADLQYISATTKATDFTLFDSFRGSVGNSVLDLRGSKPYISIPANAAFADPSQYYWDAAMDFHDHNNADEWAERIDGSYTFDGDWLKSFRFGVRHTQRDAVTRETNFNWGYVTQTWSGAGLALLNGTGPTAAGNTIPSAPMPLGNFFRGGVNAPTVFYAGTPGFMSNFLAASNAIIAAENRPSSCCGPWLPFNGDYNAFTSGGGSGGINSQNESTIAAYGLLNFAHNLTFMGGLPMDGNIGVRIVNTKAAGTGSLVYPLCNSTCSGGTPASLGPPPVAALPPYPTADQNFQNGIRTTFTGGRTYTDVLPSLNLRFKIRPDLFLRLAASQSIVRPDFSQMEPTLTIGYQGGLLSGGTCNQLSGGGGGDCVYRYTAYEGNPTLKPVRANSYDMALEWYFASAGSVTGTVFAKDIYNFITTGTQNVSFTNNGVTENVLLNRPYNAGHGTVRGFELTYQQYYSFLPGPLKGLGMQANFTYIDSKGARNAAQDPYDTTQVALASSLPLPLEGLSKTSYNLAGLYDYGPVSARLAYTWRSQYLMTPTAANINIPAWAADYGSLDASIFYTFSPKLKVGIQAANLTDSVYREFVSYPSTVNNPGFTMHNWVDGDRRFSLVVRGQF